MAVSAASHRVAPNHAHLHAIKCRRRGLKDEGQTDTDGDKGIFTEKVCFLQIVLFLKGVGLMKQYFPILKEISDYFW